ncbi:hypothetical protein [Endozoicomonas sp. GU-1]|nr:hypothetical protein [Endozoicomonas sp. GU-1]WBA88515.1 hypothetical protein O3276_11210 [Endozoicomonas sp. GU-1]
MKLRNHVRCHDFAHRVNDLLLTSPPVKNYQIKGKDFIKTLIAMIEPANSIA